MIEKIKLASDQMPVLSALQDQYFNQQPLIGKRIGACLHITKETAVLLKALANMGADVYACGSNPLSTQDDVVEELNNCKGIKVFAKHGQTKEEYWQSIHEIANCKPHIVIDDGADLIMYLHENAQYRENLLFAQEETTTGIQRIKAYEKQEGLKFPIFLINDTPTKRLFDNIYGTGQSVIDGIIRATNTLLAGKTFVIAGYGHCGKGLAQRAKGMGCNVIVTEIDPVKALQAYMDGFRVMPMIEASFCGDLFITVTGNRDVILAEDMINMKPGAILANAGHFDVEIDTEAAKKYPVKLLAEGRLVNLVCAEGHPSEVMDMSFSNQFLNAVDNSSKVLENKSYDITGKYDNIIAEIKLKSLGIKIDELTDEQKEYIS